MDQLIDFSALIIQGINFAIVAYVLRRFLFIPYMRMIDAETKKRKELEEQIAKASHIVENAHAQADNIIDQAKVDARMTALEIVNLAHKDAKSITDKAQIDADMARTKGFADIANKEKSFQKEMEAKVLDVALALNKKIFGKSSEAHEEFLAKQDYHL